ncbi:MAG TPA: HEPN domain-containing protein [Anaerolineae bacterium]|nr:HEPN domain-containing protein [Anaerolineae bacterium]
MSEAKTDEVRAWLNKSHHDLEAAEWLLARPKPLTTAAGFHAQQAAEKALKAYLTWQEQPFGKTHSLVALVGQCMHFEQEFATLRQAATTLTPYAVASRYPGDLPELSEEEAREAVALARQVWDFVLSRFPTSLDLP